MKIVFHNDFYNSDYSNDGAAVPGRMESIMHSLANEDYTVLTCHKADYEHIALAHEKEYIEQITRMEKIYPMALRAAGGAIKASEIALGGEAAFACIRPPGHHAYTNNGWGYCYFSNMAIALLNLKERGHINNAFVLDFDTHTGDGTINVLSKWKEVKILNPMAENNNRYMKIIEEYIRELKDIDIIAVCAGFDSYVKDLGKKLTTFDFYKIGVLMKQLAKRMGHNRRFAVLEGGYYLPDLGKNVLAFCQGFDK